MLSPIVAVPGVAGAALFDASHTCIAQQLAPPYEAVLLGEVVKKLADVSNAFEGTLLRQTNLVAARFETGSLVVFFKERLHIAVLCQSRTNLSTLKVALNVTSLKAQEAVSQSMQGSIGMEESVGGARLHESMDRRSHGEMPGLPPALGLTESAAPGMNAAADPERLALSLGESRRSLPSQSVSMSWSERSTSPVGTVGMKVMHHVLRALTVHLGTQAKSVLEQELVALRATPRSLTVVQFADLIRRTAARIPEPEQRKVFLRDALGDARP